jgi:drug/metabolite transporter (DMT)-like permease
MPHLRIDAMNSAGQPNAMPSIAEEDSLEAYLPSDPPPIKSELTTYMWLGTVPLIWGFNFICLKILYSDAVGFTVPAVLSARYIIMVLALGAVMLFGEKDRRIAREDWKYLITFAIVTVGIYQFVFAKAIQLTSAAEASLLISTAPIWVFLLSLLLHIEQFDRGRMFGVLVGFLGVVLVIFGSGGSATVPETHLTGDLIMVAAAILWGSYAVFSRPLLAKYSPMKIVAYIHIIGSVIIIPIGFKQMLAVPLLTMGLVPWLCVLQYSLLAGVYAFIVWYRGVQCVGASQTMLYQYFVPLVAVVAAYLILKEQPTLLQVAGIAITLAGVHLARKQNVAPLPE